jgi:hypothetical protein
MKVSSGPNLRRAAPIHYRIPQFLQAPNGPEIAIPTKGPKARSRGISCLVPIVSISSGGTERLQGGCSMFVIPAKVGIHFVLILSVLRFEFV